MKLTDIIDINYGLQQDEWSEQSLTFGNKGQLSVIGFSGQTNGARHKKYVVKCSICSLDEELFGDGVFIATKYHLASGRTPCGCSKITYWTEEQYRILCKRACESLGNIFIGWEGDFRGCVKTKVVQACPTHGQWNTGNINNLTSKHSYRGCPRCRIDLLVSGAVSALTKEDSVHITDFMATGRFPEGTKFTKRYDLPDSYGRFTNWQVDCPVCGTSEVSNASNLKRGHTCCRCSNRNPTIAYINIVLDDNNPIALKFGITNNPSMRVYTQNRQSIYTVSSMRIFYFPDTRSCKQAEIACKKECLCGILPKEEFLDGYTETTYLYNLEKIESIFRIYGGVDET